MAYCVEPPETEGPPSTSTRVMIVVGRTGPANNVISLPEDVCVLPIDRLTRETLREQRPSLVLSTAMGRDIDALDVAETLANIGYKGPYRAAANDIPHPDMLCQEVRQQVPGLDFDLIDLPRLA